MLRHTVCLPCGIGLKWPGKSSAQRRLTFAAREQEIGDLLRGWGSLGQRQTCDRMRQAVLLLAMIAANLDLSSGRALQPTLSYLLKGPRDQ